MRCAGTAEAHWTHANRTTRQARPTVAGLPIDRARTAVEPGRHPARLHDRPRALVREISRTGRLGEPSPTASRRIEFIERRRTKLPTATAPSRKRPVQKLVLQGQAPQAVSLTSFTVTRSYLRPFARHVRSLPSAWAVTSGERFETSRVVQIRPAAYDPPRHSNPLPDRQAHGVRAATFRGVRRALCRTGRATKTYGGPPGSGLLTDKHHTHSSKRRSTESHEPRHRRIPFATCGNRLTGSGLTRRRRRRSCGSVRPRIQDRAPKAALGLRRRPPTTVPQQAHRLPTNRRRHLGRGTRHQTL